MKDEKVIQETIFVDPWFDSHKETFDDICIDEVLNKQQNKRSEKIQNWTHESSGWNVHAILHHQLFISEITPCKSSSYFPLPKELINTTRGLINIPNNDNECFRWCLVRYLNKKQTKTLQK